MFFGTAITAAFLGAVVSAGLTALGRGTVSRIITSAITVFVISGLLDWLYLYFGLPSFTGTLGGFGWLIRMNAVIIVLIGAISMWTTSDSRSSRYDERDTKKDLGGLCLALGAAAIVGLGFFWWLGCEATYHWGKDNKVFYSSFANVEDAAPDETLPPTDPSHIVVTSLDVAFVRATTALGQDQQLSTLYQVLKSELTLQTINNHLYYAVPLEYQSTYTQFGWFGHKYFPTSPGYVRVDAEDPNRPGQLFVGGKYEMKYFPGAAFSENLLRHIYEGGYTHGDLDDPTLEVADDGTPYFTVTYNKYKRVVDGEFIEKVLVVNAGTGVIETYDLGKVPAWVDRVMSTRLHDRYLQDYLQYAWDPHALDNYSFIFGANGNQFKVGDQEILYNKASEHPILLSTVTSIDNTNDAVVGLIVCLTDDNKCKRYKHITGLQPASHATAALMNVANPNGGANPSRVISDIQLYVIDGRPTWLALFTSNSGPAGFIGVGMVDATTGKTQGSNAVFGSDLRTALYRYGQKVVTEESGNQTDVTSGGLVVQTAKGKVFRVGQFVSGGESLFTLTLSSDGTPAGVEDIMFLVNPVLILGITQVHEGDDVTVSYTASAGTPQMTVNDLTDASLARLGKPLLRGMAAQPQ
jgi:hypothetical protein